MIKDEDGTDSCSACYYGTPAENLKSCTSESLKECLVGSTNGVCQVCTIGHYISAEGPCYKATGNLQGCSQSDIYNRCVRCEVESGYYQKFVFSQCVRE
jgi:hypothetical protein